MGLSAPNRSIHKSHALPPGDSVYTKSKGFTSTSKGTIEEMSHNPVLTSLLVVLYRFPVIEIVCIIGRV